MRFRAEMGLKFVIVYRSYYKLSGLLIGISILMATESRAQEADSSTSDFFDESPLILTASRMSKPLIESPASVSVISRQMIESSGARELPDIFRLVPGFIVGNPSGNSPVVTYHGLGLKFSRQLQVLIDGRSVFIPSFGGVPWNNLPLLLEDIERVEVIRGPNAVTYGANAFLATINIITRHSAEDFGARYGLSSSGGTYPQADDIYLRVGGHVNDLDWRLSAGKLRDDGFESLHDSRDTSKLNFRADYLVDHNQFLTIHTGTSNTANGIGVSDNETNIERDEEATNSYFNLSWEQIENNNSTVVRLTHTEQEVNDHFQAEPITLGGIPGFETFIDFDRTSKRTDFELVRTSQIDDSLRVVYGLSLRKDRVKSLLLLNDERFHDIDTSRLFSSVEWRANRNWILDFGVTLEDSSLTEKAYSPRFSALRNIGKNHMLRFVASRAQRNPILYEHSGSSIFTTSGTIPGLGDLDIEVETFRGNPEIIPEDIISYEFGLRSHMAEYSISSDIKLFTYEVTDFIGDDSFDEPHPQLTSIRIGTSKNDDFARVTGLELSFDITPVENLEIKTGISIISVETDDRSIEASFPDSTGFLTASYAWKQKHSFSTSLYYIGEMEWLDVQDVTPSINKLDIRYAYMLDGSSETRIELIGQNLAEDYTDYVTGNLSGKTYLVRISGGF